jgi:hydroxymethylbilane synthase
MKLDALILGTRSSALALAQTELTRNALAQRFSGLRVEVETFVTQGDKKLDLELLRSPGGGKGLFTKELEVALLARSIDVAVHSMKDLPASMPEGLGVGAVLPRAATADLLICKKPGGLDALPPGARVGTSSIRRARQLGWIRKDLQVAEWRGNVQTRLRKLAASSEFEAILLAQAGLDRLGFNTASGVLEFEGGRFYLESLEDRMLPAIGQGAVALQYEKAREEVGEVLQALNDEPTWRAIRAERELQRLLAGDCTLPVGVATQVQGERIRMRALLFVADSSEPRQTEAEGLDPEEVARKVAAGLGALEGGGGERERG